MSTRPLNHAVRRIRDRASRGDVDRMPDGDLLTAFIATRAESAFAELLRRHGPMVLAVCRRLVGHRQDAEDAFQATFLILARRADSVRPRELVGAWLHGVARRCAGDSRRADQRRRTREGEVPPIGTVEAAPPEVAQRNELASLIDAELARLPEALRVPVVLCELEGRPRAEVAELLGLPEGTLSSRLAAARKRLAVRLSGRGLALAAFSTAAVSNGLANSTLAMVAGGTVPPAVADILKGASQMNRFATWKMTAAVMASVGLAGGVAVSMAGTPEAPPAAEPVAFSGEFVAAAAQDADDKFSIANLPPVVIKTVPTSGAEDVDPDTTELRATFSKDMIVENFSWVQVSKEHFPETTGKPKFEDDKRTCVLPVKLQPGKTYVLWLNQGRFSSFMDPKGNRAVPYMLVFRTADADE